MTAAGTVSNLPLSGQEEIDWLTVEGRPRPANSSETPLADLRQASPGYFEAMGIRLLRGRTFNGADRTGAPGVAVVNQTLARTYWPGADPIGKRIRFGDLNPKKKPEWLTVVGVVDDVRNSSLEGTPRPQAYLAAPQDAFSEQYVVLRAKGDPKDLIASARSAIWSVDRDQPVGETRTMSKVVSQSVAGRRFNMVLLGAFAALALALAAVGIYGITAYSVAQRTREMGLRMALGARPGEVLGLVLREAGSLALAGLVAGLVLAFAATRVMASLLFGIGASDPLTFASVAATLALVALFAAWVPGRRATQVDPMVALRTD